MMDRKKVNLGTILRGLARNAVAVAVVVAAFAVGFWLKPGGVEPSSTNPTTDEHAGHEGMGTSAEHGQDAETTWTCAMHPQIQQDEPGQCPLCGMNLIPVAQEASGGSSNPRTFVTSEAARAMMQIQTSPVERRFAEAEIRMSGKIEYDETQLGYITAWVPGRIDKMYVDFTGIKVNKGDHLVSLYSPDILTAQSELRRATQAVARLRTDAPDIVRQTAKSTLVAAQEKLRRWGLTNEQIEQAKKEGISSDHITIYAPMGGTVIHRNGQEGMYVDVGSRIYTIADLSQVWVMLDAYESDLGWLHYGQTVSFATEAYPGEVFEGRIAFIEPTLDKVTRTVKVRVNVPNPDGRLKPEMFVRATVRAKVATEGRVMDPNLAGKWIAPMHPEIVKDGPGECEICGMALVKAEDLGYVAVDTSVEAMPLVIPVSAVLKTGIRAIAYVEVPDAEQPTYEGREIVLGPRAGDFYLVRSGLQEGERVVTNGNFKIDSALQLMAKPSMMSPEGGTARSGGGHAH